MIIDDITATCKNDKKKMYTALNGVKKEKKNQLVILTKVVSGKRRMDGVKLQREVKGREGGSHELGAECDVQVLKKL